MYIVLKKEGNKTMKKFAISLLVLALAFGVAANAAVGLRANITGSNVPLFVVGLNNIDILLAYGQNTPSAANGSTINNGNQFLIGATYFFAKLGDGKVGVNASYSSSTLSSVAPAAANTAVTMLSLALEGKAEVSKGLYLGISAPLYTTTSAAAGNSSASTLLWNTSSVYAQIDLF